MTTYCPQSVPNPLRCPFIKGYRLQTKYTRVAYSIFRTHDRQVSEKIVPFHLRQIHPLEGSNCMIMGRRGLVRTLSSIRSSNKLTVDACSIIDSGVVKTMDKAVEDRCCRCIIICRRSHSSRRAFPKNKGEYKLLLVPHPVPIVLADRDFGAWRLLEDIRAWEKCCCCIHSRRNNTKCRHIIIVEHPLVVRIRAAFSLLLGWCTRCILRFILPSVATDIIARVEQGVWQGPPRVQIAVGESRLT